MTPPSSICLRRFFYLWFEDEPYCMIIVNKIKVCQYLPKNNMISPIIPKIKRIGEKIYLTNLSRYTSVVGPLFSLEQQYPPIVSLIW